jgi:hypothetical protein
MFGSLYREPECGTKPGFAGLGQSFHRLLPLEPQPERPQRPRAQRVSHRIIVEVDDLNTTLNPGATYFSEAAYVTPHEYAWCQAHPGQCNMFNNASYRQYNVSGITNFTFSAVGPTVRMEPAIMAWTGATVQQIEPDPGNDGILFVGYKVTGPTAGVWHYEYAIYNQNLDRAIQSFGVVFPGFQPGINNVEFHAPPQHPGWPHDGTVGDAGYSSTPWDFTVNFIQPPFSATWSTETFAQNQNANAIRWGTLYSFRFDSSAAPMPSTASIGFFKTGSPLTVEIQGPFMSDMTPTPTPTPGPITLGAAGRKVGGINTVRLTWSGATSTNIDIYRNGVLIVTTANDGFYIDSTGDTGRARYTYRVCEAGTATCSNECESEVPAIGERGTTKPVLYQRGVQRAAPTPRLLLATPTPTPTPTPAPTLPPRLGYWTLESFACSE